MTVLAFAIIVAACVAMVVTHVRLQRQMAGNVLVQQEQLKGQANAQYKQAKVFQKELRSTQLATARVSDECARLLADTRQLHEVAQDMVREVRGNG